MGKSSTDGLSSVFSEDPSIEFDVGVVRINRAYLKPVLFNLDGCISKVSRRTAYRVEHPTKPGPTTQ